MPEAAEHFAISDQVVTSDLGDEIVLLHLKSSLYFGLDRVGSRIWELLKEEAAVDSICDTLAEEFDVDADEIEPDIRSFLDDLLKNDIITRQ